jgi:hypothetical protein
MGGGTVPHSQNTFFLIFTEGEPSRDYLNAMRQKSLYRDMYTMVQHLFRRIPLALSPTRPVALWWRSCRSRARCRLRPYRDTTQKEKPDPRCSIVDSGCTKHALMRMRARRHGLTWLLGFRRKE